MDDQLERAAVAQPDRGEVTCVAGRDATDAEAFCERHDRSIYEAKAEI